MKKLIFLAAICAASLSAKAQAAFVQVYNYTSVNVIYDINGDPLGACSWNALQGPFVIPPTGAGAPVTMPAGIFGIGATITGASLRDCAGNFTGFTIGEPCAGPMPLPATATFTGCAPGIVATWITGGPAGTATLEFR